MNSDLSEEDLRGLRTEFFIEALEMMDDLEPMLLEIEKGDASDMLREVKNLIHSLKGAASSSGLPQVSDVVHKLETYIEAHEKQIDSGFVSNILKFIDVMRQTSDLFEEGNLDNFDDVAGNFISLIA